MKITRYLWINNLPKHCQEEEIQKTFQSHGKIQTIRIHGNNHSRGAIVAFIDCKSSTKAFESVKTLQKIPLKLEYCEANGEPGITSLGLSGDASNNNKVDNQSGSNKTSDSRSRSSSSSSNTSSFGSSLDDCSKYPPIQFPKRVDNNNTNDDEFDRSSSKSVRVKPVNEPSDKNDKECLNTDYRGLLVENLSQRSSDTSLREGLFHEYKKHGKITSVAVMGQGTGRHAIISFKRSEDMEKAFDVSMGKIFFGNPIRVSKHNGYNYIDPDLCPPEHAMDEYHPKATKTLFVGKLATGAVVELDLKKVFKKYGEIIDIDIKTQSNQPDTSFAFVQYYDISSVVRALRNQDSIKVDGKPVKLGFGKSQPANCLWIGNLQRNANESFLRRHFKRFGSIMLVIPDPEYNCALIQFDGAEDALRAFTDTRERSNNNNNMSRRMQVDYASNEYQMAFMNRLRKSCQLDTQDFLKNMTDPYQTEKIQNLLISYTKYLGLLDETRTRSYDRYDTKSDYDDYDDFYTSRQSRQRKSVHQRLYNDSYGVDDDYSDDYHYTKPKSRHYDEYSSSRSPVRYSRTTSQKYPADQQYGSHDSRRSQYQHYNSEYYDTKTEPSSSTYYPYRRTPDSNYIHSNHNRSYSPSPTSSLDYCDDYPRYNLSPKRYSRPNKEYNHSRISHEPHFERISETRNWTKPSRREFDDYLSFRSKSGSKSKISDSVSPHTRNTTRSSLKEPATKKTHSRKTNNNNNDVFEQRSSLGKAVLSTTDNNRSTKPISNNLKPKPTNITVSSISELLESTKAATESGNLITAVQPVDALSKLERERAKLLAELSLLSEDTSDNAANNANKATKLANIAVKVSNIELNKQQKKPISPKTTDTNSAIVNLEKKHAVAETVNINVDIVTSKIRAISEKIEVVTTLPSSAVTGAFKPSCDIPITVTNKPELLVPDIFISKSLTATLPAAPLSSSSSSSSVAAAVPTILLSTSTLSSSSSLTAATVESSITNQSRDPRLNSFSYHIRPLSNSTVLVATSSVHIANPIICVASSATKSEPTVIPIPSCSMFKDSGSDSDLDQFNNIDFEVDKRIRELDAKMNRNEQTVRTLDYSKFRIRKKGNDSANVGVTTLALVNSSPSFLMVSSSNSLVSTSSLLDVGYSNTSRDTGSNTSEFIKTMLNQTKQKSFLSDSNSDHLNSICSNYAVVSTSASSLSSSIPFRTVDLGANDIERRTMFSRFGTNTSNSLSFTDSKLNVDTTLLSPTISSYSCRLPTSTVSISTAIASTVSAKVLIPLTISPTTTVSTTSTPSTPNIIDSNQPMKSILKKSNVHLINQSNKTPDTLLIAKSKSTHDLISPVEHLNNNNNNNNNNQSKKFSSKKLSSSNLKRTIKAEFDDVDIKPHVKKSRNDTGPVLDDTLFQTYPTMPVKKIKKPLKKPVSTLSDVIIPSAPKKSSVSSNSFVNTYIPEKVTSKRIDRTILLGQSNQKIVKNFKENKKTNSTLSVNKSSKLKSKSTGNLKKSQIRKGKSKSNKLEKRKKLTKRNKDKSYYGGRNSDKDVNDDLEDDTINRFSDVDDDDDTDNENYESMYDKIKRRNSKANRINMENNRRHAFGIKKRHSKHDLEFVALSSDNLDSEDSEYWSVKSSKRSAHLKRKRPRLSDISSSHFSDSNSCKTTPCGKSQETLHLSEYSGLKSELSGHNKAMYSMKSNDDNVKDESITDESKAPAESFNLSSPHNSSQCSSPKYTKEVNVMSVIKESYEANNFKTESVLCPIVITNNTRSLHRPNDGPLKKRPITEPIMLSEDLPYLEKQPEEEYIVTSPTSINEEPPSQLESMYDLPSSHQPNVLEEVALDDQHNSSDVANIEYTILESTDCDPADQITDLPLPADVNSASHILLTMKSQPTIDVEYPATVVTNEPDQQLQSVAEHLISLAQNSMQSSLNTFCESAVPSSIQEDDTQQHQQHQILQQQQLQHQQSIQTVCSRSSKINQNVRQDDEVTIYVKNIIDRIKHETDVANTMNKDKLACKRAKKTNTFNIPVSKPMTMSNMSHECRHILPIDMDSSARLTTATISTTQQLTLATVTSSCVMVQSSQVPPESPITITKVQSLKQSQMDEKRSLQGDDTASISSTDKRIRHNSNKSDNQLQSLDETIENVVKSSMSSSASDAVSNKSVTDIDVNIDESKSVSNSNDGINTGKYDLTSLEETMNEVINKMNVNSPLTAATSQNSITTESDTLKPNPNNGKTQISHEVNKKKMTLNHLKQQPVYQLTSNVTGITNLVLGIPSILTVNTIVSQQNSLNHMVSFQNSVSGQNKLSNQLALPLNKLGLVTSIQSSVAQSSSSCVSSLSSLSLPSSSSQVLPSLALTPTNINIQGQQPQHIHNANMSVQSTEMVFTKLNSLTPIMIQTPLRNITPLAQNTTNSNQTMLGGNRAPVNPLGATLVSIATGIPVCNMTTDTSSGKIVSVSLSATINKPITTPLNVVSRTPMPTTPHGLNLTKITGPNIDSSYYLMMQRQTNNNNQSQQSKVSSLCQSVSSSDGNVSGLNNVSHSIILSQLTHTNSVLSPITPGYLAATINRSNPSSIPLQTLTGTNGIATTCSGATPSILFRPLNIPYPKFEEKDDWLKQNKHLDLNYPIRWTGKLCLKNDEVFVQMHMLAGNEDLIKNSMNLISAGQLSSQPLRIVQRMRLEPNQLEGLQRRLTRQLEFCTCLTLAGGDKPDELIRTSTTLNENFISYLQEKSAAGIINISIPDSSQQNAYVIHIFPPCQFSDNQLRSCSAKLYEKLKENTVPYLVIVITTV